ncbi:hypothetical protein GGI25_003197 [Coemansia spiralis]|uniref:Yeast cell wall synthesis Kre9/Knh1-like N-terminal domain-containing protein n=2 Tax=Coemansia TaxID=4863 RepID=A0A9W8KYA3_9FUNG|nr:hypothetical protein BX070DRAFT_225859 [Coemansia spiralis]KAJ1991836.1 hypothetical protein EDC05_003191 [Coemansia umbellata]KAJ2621887.1 hypothetical protein GGI26_003730 [Coemansia sp. RSA 1358]KAJ2677442.1 hypothetical protein GGI25_003197 [Coemansia spiralis]
MKFSIAAISALAASAFGALSINSPVAGTVWPSNSNSVKISWVSDDGTALTGTVTIQLMEGADTNNLSPVYTVATNYPASNGQISFVPPSNLPESSYYAVRVTSSIDGPHYSHQFQAGNPSITSSPSSGITVTGSATASTTSQSSASAASSKSRASTSTAKASTSSDSSEEQGSLSEDASSDESNAATSDNGSEESSGESDADSNEESSEKSHDEKSSHSGASRPALAAGLLGVAAFAALF